MKALIFDLDGTLLNTLGDLKNSVNYAMKIQGFQERTLEEVRTFVGNGMRRLIALSMPEGSTEEAIEYSLKVMKSHYGDHCHVETLPYEGIVELLQTLKAQGYRMAIVSNKADPMVKTLWGIYFADTIEVALGESPRCARKPAPDMVWAALDDMGLAHDQAVYIGDSEVDLLTAKNAGIPCIPVCWGFRTPEELRAAGAEHPCATAGELLSAIEILAK